MTTNAASCAQVCELCFQAREVRAAVRRASTAKGPCAWCGSRNARVAGISDVADQFDFIRGIYRELDDDTVAPWESGLDVGDQLLTLVQSDHGAFSPRLLRNRNKASRLLIHLANLHWEKDSGDPLFDAQSLYIGRDSWTDVELDEILDVILREELTEQNFNEQLQSLLQEIGDPLDDFAKTLATGRRFFRCRPGSQPDGGPWVSIGAPPAEMAEAGRCNRVHVAVLYCANTPGTARIEASNHAAPDVEELTIGSIQLVRNVRVLDLAVLHRRPTAFGTDGAGFARAARLHALLCAFRWALTRTDLPNYLSTQLMAEYAQRMGFDGILYPSVRSGGRHNLVLFDLLAYREDRKRALVPVCSRASTAGS